MGGNLANLRPKVALLVLLGCQQGNGATEVAPEYRQDIASVCDVMTLSGAGDKDPAERPLATAMWLNSHLKTKQARDFLISVQPLVGEPKAKALEAEATRVGLPSCALAVEWRR